MRLNIHDIVEIELNNITKEIEDYVKKYYSSFIEDDAKQPDIQINFVDRLEIKNCEYLGDIAMYNKNHLFLVDHKGSKANIFFEDSENGFNISCEKAFDITTLFISILEQLLEYLLNKNNAAFIHASCVFYRGRCIMFHGWRGSGKTGVLLNFLAEGAEYMSDDIVIVSGEGNALSFPSGINLTDFNFKELPELKRVRNAQFSLEVSIKKLLRLLYKLSTYVPLNTLKRIGDDVNKINTHYLIISNRVPFKKLFPKGNIRKSSSINEVYFLNRTETKNIEVTNIGKRCAVTKMLHCREYERIEHTRFHSYFDLFSFAFAKKNNPFEKSYGKKREILSNALNGKKIYDIKIPLNMSSREVFKFLRSLA